MYVVALAQFPHLVSGARLSQTHASCALNGRFIGDLAGGGFQARMDHLACFLGGTLMMASQGAKDAESQTFYTEIAVGLTDTCHHAYNRTATGLGPDIMSWGHGHDGRGSGGSQFYWLRPEVGPIADSVDPTETQLRVPRLPHDCKICTDAYTPPHVCHRRSNRTSTCGGTPRTRSIGTGRGLL
jgi:hypothetical protein